MFLSQNFRREADAGQAAIAWEAGGKLSVEDVEVSPPKAHEVRVKILWTGVCILKYCCSRKDMPDTVGLPYRCLYPFRKRS